MLNVGIIGTGLIAREHASAISLVSDKITLLAAADIASGRLDEFCGEFGVARRYKSGADLLADPDVELVAIATPPGSHEESVLAALAAGKFALCEKPLAHTLASADAITNAEHRNPGRLSVSYQLRFEPAFQRLLWLCQNGWIGEIESATIERHSYIPHSTVGKGGWWGSWNVAGGGVLMTQLIHEIDILLLALGEPISVSAAMDTRFTEIESEDWVEARVQFAGGKTALVRGSVNSGSMGGKFVITGSLGSVSPGELHLRDPKRQLEAIRAADSAFLETRAPGMSFGSRAWRKILRRFHGSPQRLTPHARLYREVAQCIQQKKPLPIPPTEAMKSLQVCAAAYESALTRKAVKLPVTSAASVYNGISKSDYQSHLNSAGESPMPSARHATRRWGPIRIGLIGLDTTHAVSFTDILHNPGNPAHIPGGKVVGGYPGGSPDMSISHSRVGAFTNELKNTYGVPILASPDEVADSADLIFILSSDGRVHPGLFNAVSGRGKPVFIDKPFAISARDAEKMIRRADETNTPVFGSSAFRYADGLTEALHLIRAAGEEIKSCRIRYWMQIQETQGRYFWYGIHASEMLLAIMGPGIRAVKASSNGDCDTITVWHKDGRESSLIGSQSDGTFQVVIETSQQKVEIDLGPSMNSLSARVLRAALDVLTQGQFPRLWRATNAGSVCGNRLSRAVDPPLAETLEVVQVLDAAQRSHASGQETPI